MRFSSILGFSILSVVLPLMVTAAPHEFEVRAPAAGLEKRFDNARMTWYDISVGVTACGGTFSNSDHVVALDSQQFDNGSNCGRQIAITALGKTINAQIVDNCPGCPFAGLDLTEGLFSEFADPSVGVITGSWDFI